MLGKKDCINYMLNHEHQIITNGTQKSFYGTDSFWLVATEDSDAKEVSDLAFLDKGEWRPSKTIQQEIEIVNKSIEWHQGLIEISEDAIYSLKIKLNMLLNRKELSNAKNNI